MDVLPDVQLGPVRQRESPDAFGLGFAGVVKLPQLGPLVFRIPAVVGRAEREDPLFRAALFFIPACAAKGHVEIILGQRLFQTIGFPHVGVQAAVIERVDALFHRFGILINDQIHPGILRRLFAQRIHVAELPRRIDMQQRKRRRRRVKRLLGQMQHRGAVLANRIQHHRVLGIRHNLAHDVNALRLKTLQVSQTAVTGKWFRGNVHQTGL